MQHDKMSQFYFAYSPLNLPKAAADFIHTIHCMKSEFCSPNSLSLHLLLAGDTRILSIRVSELWFLVSEQQFQFKPALRYSY